MCIGYISEKYMDRYNSINIRRYSIALYLVSEISEKVVFVHFSMYYDKVMD